jgi:hypothetical protein
MLAALPHSTLYTKQWIVLHQSANQEYNIHCICNPHYIDQDFKIGHQEEEYVYTHVRVAQVAFWVQVAPILVEVHPFLCASSMMVDSLRCKFRMEGSRRFRYPKPLPVWFYRNLYHVMTRKQHTAQHLCSGIALRLFD